MSPLTMSPVSTGDDLNLSNQDFEVSIAHVGNVTSYLQTDERLLSLCLPVQPSSIKREVRAHILQRSSTDVGQLVFFFWIFLMSIVMSDPSSIRLSKEHKGWIVLLFCVCLCESALCSHVAVFMCCR